jgi:NAD(P)-dependent dehydrogenase (short-subunit alcohol dehydrogenase family)
LTAAWTGAGSGIGRATALIAARDGLAVAAWDRNEAAVAGVVTVIRVQGGAAEPVILDVDDYAAVDEALRSLALGPCRYLVTNAGPLSRPESPYDFDYGVRLAVDGGCSAASAQTETPPKPWSGDPEKMSRVLSRAIAEGQVVHLDLSCRSRLRSA